METYNDWLAHHGILGMKWGKKNGPPYPLSDDQMSAVEKRNNEVSEFASKVKHESKLRKIQERENIDKEKMARRELVRQHKFEEKEGRRQTKAQEREEHRQNRVDEREIRRQHRFDDAEQIRQNRVEEQEEKRQDDFDSKETYEKYKSGKKYVTKALVGIGVTAVSLYAAYKVGNKVTGGKLSEGVKSMFKKDAGAAPVTPIPTPDPAGPRSTSHPTFSSNKVSEASWKTKPSNKFEPGKTYLRTNVSGPLDRTLDFGKLTNAQRTTLFKRQFGVTPKQFQEYMKTNASSASNPVSSVSRSFMRGPDLKSAKTNNVGALRSLATKTSAPESVRKFMPNNATNWGKYTDETRKAITRIADKTAYESAAKDAASGARGLAGQKWVEAYFSKLPRR